MSASSPEVAASHAARLDSRMSGAILVACRATNAAASDGRVISRCECGCLAQENRDGFGAARIIIQGEPFVRRVRIRAGKREPDEGHRNAERLLERTDDGD